MVETAASSTRYQITKLELDFINRKEQLNYHRSIYFNIYIVDCVSLNHKYLPVDDTRTDTDTSNKR